MSCQFFRAFSLEIMNVNDNDFFSSCKGFFRWVIKRISKLFNYAVDIKAVDIITSICRWGLKYLPALSILSVVTLQLVKTESLSIVWEWHLFVWYCLKFKLCSCLVLCIKTPKCFWSHLKITSLWNNRPVPPIEVENVLCVLPIAVCI